MTGTLHILLARHRRKMVTLAALLFSGTGAFGTQPSADEIVAQTGIKRGLVVVLRVLRPRGAAYLAAKSSSTLGRVFSGLKGVKVIWRQGGRAAVARRRPAGRDNGSHVAHGADNHRAGSDKLIYPPLTTQWQAGPRVYDILGVTGEARYGHAFRSKPVTANGRVFFFNIVAGRRRNLVALDAYKSLVIPAGSANPVGYALV